MRVRKGKEVIFGVCLFPLSITSSSFELRWKEMRKEEPLIDLKLELYVCSSVLLADQSCSKRMTE